LAFTSLPSTVVVKIAPDGACAAAGKTKKHVPAITRANVNKNVFCLFIVSSCGRNM
jgi:hypothetical protein